MSSISTGEFDQTKFNHFIVENRVIGFFKEPVRLKSGRISNWYVNWRTVSEDVFLTDILSDYVIAYVKTLLQSGKLAEAPDCFYGVPEGATKLGIITQYKWAKSQTNFSKGSHTLAMGRGKPKEHGVPRDRFYVGMPTGKVVILEDVTTTGSSLIETIKNLQLTELEIVAAIGLTNRMERRDDGVSVAEAVERLTSKGRPIPYYQLSSSLELLPLAFKSENPGELIKKEIEKEFLEVGIEPIDLG